MGSTAVTTGAIYGSEGRDILFLSATRANVREQRQAITGSKTDSRAGEGLIFHSVRGLTQGFCLFVCVCVYVQMIYNSRERETMCLCCMCKQRKIMFHKEQSVRQRFFEYFCGINEGRVV